MSEAVHPKDHSNLPDRGFTQVALAAGAGRSRRDARVLLLLTGVLIMSLADLALTLLCLSGPGMPEDNPIARWIISLGSPAALVAFKLACLLLASLVLYKARHTTAAEIGLWIAFAVLTWLSFRWLAFIDFAPAVAAAADHGPILDENWLRYED